MLSCCNHANAIAVASAMKLFATWTNKSTMNASFPVAAVVVSVCDPLLLCRFFSLFAPLRVHIMMMIRMLLLDHTVVVVLTAFWHRLWPW